MGAEIKIERFNCKLDPTRCYWQNYSKKNQDENENPASMEPVQ